MQPRAMSSAKTQLTGKGQVPRDASTESGQEHPVEAGPAEGVARHRRGTEDGARMGGDHVLSGRGPGHGVLEGRHLGDRVGIRARLLHHRGVLALEAPGRVEERAGADGDDPAHAEGLGGVEDVLGALDVHGLEVGQVLAGPAQERGAVDGGVGTGGGPADVVGIGDVAGHDLDPQGDKGRGVGCRAGQGPDTVAPLDQELADVGAGQPGGAGDEDRLAHAGACSAASA